MRNVTLLWVLLVCGLALAVSQGSNSSGALAAGFHAETGMMTTTTCDTSVQTYYSSTYQVAIVQAESDKATYMPGDTASLLGTVSLQRQDIYVDACGNFYQTDWKSDDASKVSVSISGDLGTMAATVGQSGAFIANMPIPSTAAAGSVTVHVTATYQTVSDSRDITFQVAAYAPQLQLTVGSGGQTGYPGDAVTLSGSGWIPSQPVTINYGALGSSATVTADASGSFSAPGITIPTDAAEGSYQIQGTEGSLAQTASLTVKWHQLAVAITVSPTSAAQGASFTVTGTVTKEDVSPVEGATVAVSSSGLGISSTATTDASGSFSVSGTVPTGATPSPPDYTLTAKATRTGGYKASGDATASLTVVAAPTSNLGLGAAAAGVGLGGALGAASGSANPGNGTTKTPSTSTRRKTRHFRIKSEGISGSLGAAYLGGAVLMVRLWEYDEDEQSWDNGRKQKFSFWGGGPGPRGLSVSGQLGTPLGDDWQEFNTSQPWTLEDFVGWGGIFCGFSAAILVELSTGTQVEFGNDELVSFNAGLSLGLQGGISILSVQKGYWSFSSTV